MFAKVNCLIFLLIFLVYFLICIAVCRRKTGLYACQAVGLLLAKYLLFCGVTAMLLTVVTIYLWFLVLILMAIVIKYVWELSIQKGRKTMIIVVLILWTVLVGTAGLQLLCSMESEEESGDALEIQEPEDSILLNGSIKSVVWYQK